MEKWLRVWSYIVL